VSDPVPAFGSGAFRFARIVSIALHPFTVFTALTLLAAWRLDPASLPRVALGMAVVVAVVWAFVWQRHRAGHWGTVDASSKHERPLLYGVVLALMLAYAAWVGRASPLASGVIAVIALLCIAGLANRWIKLSLHMASLAFCAIALWPISRGIAMSAFALLPLLGWARLRMARHTWPEVLGGTLLGLATGIVLLLMR
jgi:hypothetical protein